jgi:hypothetical protein
MAREQWEQWFSEEAAFHRVIEWCLQIRERRVLPEKIGRLPAYLQLLRPIHLRWMLRPRYYALRDRLVRKRSGDLCAEPGARQQANSEERPRHMWRNA